MENNQLRPPAVLDKRQLERIQGVHRGFFYQHLYTVGCILLALDNEVRFITVERDEDIEISIKDAHLYVQVKTRSEPLREGDVKGSLELFKKIEKEHLEGKRSLAPRLNVISNSQPGRDLLKAIKADIWPPNIHIVWPGLEQHESSLPPAWQDIQTGFKWCVNQAQRIPYSTLSPDNLVLKLSAWVQQLCTGELGEEHIIRAETLPKLFEQIITQLQSLPAPPAEFYPLEGNLKLESTEPVRIINGLSGAGKTAWVAQEVIRLGSPVVYFDAIGAENETLLPSLVREVVAALAGTSSKGLGEIILPGSSSIDSLRALGRWLQGQENSPYVVFDNAHTVSPDLIKDIVLACSEIKWVLLTQPGKTQRQLEVMLGISSIPLGEWSVETVAVVLKHHCVKFKIQECVRFRKATGGLPLYTLSAISLVNNLYGSQLTCFLDEFELAENLEQTAQERILAKSFEQINSHEKMVCSVLRICNGVPLYKEELLVAVKCLGVDKKRDVISSIRTLLDSGIVQRIENGRYKMHDAYGVLSQSYLDVLPVGHVNAAKRVISDEMLSSYKKELNIDRINLQLRLLCDIGDISFFIEICTSVSALFQELGISERVKSLLESILSSNKSISEGDKFWIQDTLAFWELHENKIQSVKSRLKSMKSYMNTCQVRGQEYINYYMKEMLLASRENRILAAKNIYNSKLFSVTNAYSARLIKYNYAVCLYENKQYKETSEQALSLVIEYLNILGLTVEGIFGKNPSDILAVIRPDHDTDNFKWVADCYDLYARAVMACGNHYGLAKIHAFKFYTMAYALNSAMKVGQDIVDDFISPIGDVHGAREFIEQALLPTAESMKLMEWLILIRSQYAVVLAYCGDYIEANRQLELVKPFRNAVGSDEQRELEDQAHLVTMISEGHVPPPRRILVESQGVYHARGAKIGRNSFCPCGSRKKYKKCCGV